MNDPARGCCFGLVITGVGALLIWIIMAYAMS